MKYTIAGFILLQLAVWSFHFTNDIDASLNVNVENITDTWEVIKVVDNDQKNVVLHFPTFNMLQLNSDNSFVRLNINGETEKGEWKLNKSKTHLLMKASGVTEVYEIIKSPDVNSNIFIIKESINSDKQREPVEYKLTRFVNS